jgi:hypothetical protein
MLQHILDRNQGVKIRVRRKIGGISARSSQNKVELFVKNYLLRNKIRVLCNPA